MMIKCKNVWAFYIFLSLCDYFCDAKFKICTLFWFKFMDPSFFDYTTSRNKIYSSMCFEITRTTNKTLHIDLLVHSKLPLMVCSKILLCLNSHLCTRPWFRNTVSKKTLSEKNKYFLLKFTLTKQYYGIIFVLFKFLDRE